MYEMSRDLPGAQFAQGMGMLARALDLLGDIDMTEVEAHAVADQMLTLQGESRRLAAVHARAADRFATSGAWVDAGAKSPRA